MNTSWRYRLFFECWFLLAMTLNAIGHADEADPTALNPTWLAATRESKTGLLSRGIQPEESAGYFAILNHVRDLPPAALRSAAKTFESERRGLAQHDPEMRFYFRRPDAEFPTFVDLHRSPEAYHGQAVTLRGHVRRLIRMPAGSNSYGFENLYEAWLYTEDSQQNPVVVVCSELPAGIPTGNEVLVDFVSVTGYFFKRYGYADQRGQWRFSPLILAARLNWTPRPPRDRWLSPAAMWWSISGAGLVLLWAGYRAVRRNNAARRRMSDVDHAAN